MMDLYLKWTQVQKRILGALVDEEGLGTIEIAIIIIILIGLALMFKTSITTFLTGLLGQFQWT